MLMMVLREGNCCDGLSCSPPGAATANHRPQSDPPILCILFYLLSIHEPPLCSSCRPPACHLRPQRPSVARDSLSSEPLWLHLLNISLLSSSCFSSRHGRSPHFHFPPFLSISPMLFHHTSSSTSPPPLHSLHPWLWTGEAQSGCSGFLECSPPT